MDFLFHRTKVLPLLVCGALLSLYVWSCLRVEPFLHPESTIAAHYWNDPATSFSQVLFNPLKTDRHAGRFRYASYLVEGAYWRLLKPLLYDLRFHDFLGLAVNIVVACLLYLLAGQFGLSAFWRWIPTIAFLASSPCFMTAVWNYRKAKILVTLMWALLAYASVALEKKNARRVWFVGSLLGFLMDPYFILLTPMLCLAFDRKQSAKGEFISSHARGLLAGGVIVLLLNGFIGPLYSPQMVLPTWPLKDIPDHYFNWRNALNFPMVLQDVLAPYQFTRRPNLGLLFTALAFGFLLLPLWRKRAIPLTISFLVCLPLVAFIVNPVSESARFATYYGLPVLFWACLALLEQMSLYRGAKVPSAVLLASVVVFCCFNQMAKGEIYAFWREKIFRSDKVAEAKYHSDWELMKEVRDSLRGNASLDLSLKGMGLYQPEWNYVHQPPGRLGLPHHDLGYCLIPIVFEKQILAGTLKLSD